MKASQMIPIPLVIATAIIGFMLFTGDIAQPIPQTTPQQIGRGVQTIKPRLINAPEYKCASWMDADTCAFDCGCGGAQVCNTETGQCHSPAGVCNAPRGC
ncbi:MAG: hypothetical protein HYU02_05910 [Thaumarchaeota archaeon]|nr:hypothetical protein [Nitrososphaerota archaeon]